MGNYLLYPFKKNNVKNNINENQENKKENKLGYSFNNKNKISSNLNDLTDFGDNDNNINSKYYHGYKYKKNKKEKKSKLLFEDKKEGIIMNNIKRISLVIFNKKEEDEKKLTKNDIVKNNMNKKSNYIKNKDNNKHNKIKKNNDEKRMKSKNKKEIKNKFKDKEEKSSQFILLNNSNTFNTLQNINKEKIVSKNKEIINNEIKLSSIFSSEDNSKKEENNVKNEIIISKNLTINEEFKEIPINGDIILNEKDERSEKDNFKENTEASEDIYIESKLIDSTIISISDDAKKERIEKLVYKNKIGLMTIFENNKIKGPVIITDIKGNSFQGYINENYDFKGYFNLKLNFNKDIIKSKYKYKNDILINKNLKDPKIKEEILIIFSNFTNLVNIYLNLSTIKYNYNYIESEILNNNNINNYGTIKYRNNSKYIGEIKNNKKHGIGIFIWPDYSRYEGEFFEDKMEGWGLIHFFDGKIFQGQILNGIPHGYGEFIWANNNRYVGNYINGQKEGFGIYITNNINEKNKKNEFIVFFGFWKNGKQDGYGIVIKNKKINYVKYKEGKKIKKYDYDAFSGKITRVINKKHEKIFFSDLETLKNIIKIIMKF